MYRPRSPASGAGQQELDRRRCLARSGAAFQQEHAAGRQAAAQDFVETGNTGQRLTLI
jgi:hypothetical protein